MNRIGRVISDPVCRPWEAGRMVPIIVDVGAGHMLKSLYEHIHKVKEDSWIAIRNW